MGEMPAARATSSSVGARGGVLLAFLSRFNHGFPSEAVRAFTCRRIIVDGISVFQSPVSLATRRIVSLFGVGFWASHTVFLLYPLTFRGDCAIINDGD
jgi:hypothetical protein